MTIDEVINKYKTELKKFFENEEIKKLIIQKDFDKIYKKWGRRYSNKILTALFLKSNLIFLEYMSEIPYNCFYGLDIKEINIPIEIEAIGKNAFVGCDNLKTIYYQGTEEEFNQIKYKDLEIPERVKVVYLDKEE